MISRLAYICFHFLKYIYQIGSRWRYFNGRNTFTYTFSKYDKVKVGESRWRYSYQAQCTYILLGIISWLLFYLIWENCVLHWDFDLKFWIVDVYTHITHKKYHTKQLLFFQKCRKLYKLLLKTIYIFPVVCSWLSFGKNVWRGPVQYLPLGWVTLIT